MLRDVRDAPAALGADPIVISGIAIVVYRDRRIATLSAPPVRRQSVQHLSDARGHTDDDADTSQYPR